VDATGRVTWTPAAGQVGGHTFTVEVSDGEESVTAQWVLNVIQPNRAPEFSTTYLAPSQAEVGVTYIADIPVTDQDGNMQSAGKTEGPADLTAFYVSPDHVHVEWTPAAVAEGDTFPVTVVCTDAGDLNDTYAWDITVVQPNRPPMFGSGFVPATNAYVGVLYAQDIPVSDLDGDDLVAKVNTGPTGMTATYVQVDGVVQVRWTPPDGIPGATVSIQISDPSGAADTLDWNMTVHAAPAAVITTWQSYDNTGWDISDMTIAPNGEFWVTTNTTGVHHLVSQTWFAMTEITYNYASCISISGQLNSLLVGIGPTSGTGLWISSDNGNTWGQLQAVPVNLPVRDILSLPEAPYVLVALRGGPSGVAKSTDGQLFYGVGGFGTDTYITDLAFDPSTGMAYAMNDNGFMHWSSGDFANWASISPSLGPTPSCIVVTTEGSNIFVGTTQAGLYRHVTSPQRDWQLVNQLPATGGVTALYVNPVTGHVFAGCADYSTWTSVDHGETWNGIAGGSTSGEPRAFASDADGQIFVGYKDGRIFRGVP
jgi:hypothetical protein